MEDQERVNGMRTASRDFNDLTWDVLKEIGFERGKADAQIFVKKNSIARIAFHATTRS